MVSAVETVERFMAEWSKSPEAMIASYKDYFTEETVWENVGLAKTTGVDQALALLAGFDQNYGVGTIAVEMLNISASGNTVLTERVDRLIAADGKEVMAIRLMGTLEVADGKIVQWRDYFDTASLPPPNAS